MSHGFALIDMGGTFTKLGYIKDPERPGLLTARAPSAMIWARADRVAARLAAEFRHLLEAGGLKAPSKSIGLNGYQRVMVCFAGRFAEGFSGPARLAYVRKWAAEPEAVYHGSRGRFNK